MQSDDPKGKFDPRPPKDRRVAGDDASDSGKSGRRTRRSSSPVAGSGGIMGRITGRSEMDRAKAKRYEPYNYESNSTQIKWVVVALTAWVLVALVLAWQDRIIASYLGDLSADGMVGAPPIQQRTAKYLQEYSEFAAIEGLGLSWQQRSTARYPHELFRSGFADDPDSDPTPQRDLDMLFNYAANEGLNCTTELEFISVDSDCDDLIRIQDKYTSLRDSGAMLFVLLIIVLLANMFAFGAFTHRSSRNLLTLKSDRQGFSPEKSVLWFFVPVLNLVKPWQVFQELFRGSDPNVSTSDQSEWKTKGKVPVIVHVWAAAFVAVFVFNPRTIGFFWYSIRETLDEVVVAHERLIIADLLLAVLGVAAIFVALELHKRQEARHAKVGDITVTPDPPVDPLERALKEGIRRKDLENQRARSKRNNLDE